MTTEETLKDKLTGRWPHLGGLYFAVFNSRESHVDAGRRAVLANFGPGAWKHVLKCKRTGIMEIFEHKPFPALQLFAETVADAAEAYHVKRASKCSAAKE